MKRTTIFLADTQPERIKAIAAQDGITSAEIIRRAVEIHLILKEANGGVTKLWVLTRVNQNLGFDEAHSFVVRAKTEEEARSLAVSECGDEGAIWLDSDLVKCVQLLNRGESGVIVRDFMAG